MTGETFYCSVCKQTKTVTPGATTGYGYRPGGKLKVCFECCGKEDLEEMKTAKKMDLYYNETTREITNWPGTLRIIATSHTVTKKTKRVCVVYFRDPHGNNWKGKQTGDDNTILRCSKF